MADIIIRGMEMPHGCSICKLSFYDGEETVCPFCGVIIPSYSEREDSCPLLELPPHGDLIDRDAIKYVTLYGAVLGTTEPIINEQPVVVPAERSGEDDH